MASDDEDDTYVTIGTPCDVPEESAPLKKTAKVADQIATDKQGRRRFHGAFTGGFSAGYFNTVGSKEGWTPSTFVSSRSKKNITDDKDDNKNEDKNDDDDDDSDKLQKVYRPEDFMDEEDFADHGIAPRKLKTTSTFDSTENELSKRKRQLQKVVDDGEVHSAIPGGLPMDDLLLPSKLSIGIKLLKKMGWKPGQGIGEKVDALQEVFESTLSVKKVYGCARPMPVTDLDRMDMKTFTGLLAPKDIQPFQYAHKDNIHGLGYSGIDPALAMFGGLTRKSSVFKPTGNEKRGIKGQAFGVGVFEEEDDDIYGNENMSNYDLSMGDEVTSGSHGWSGPVKRSANKGCLSGFSKASKTLTVPKTPIMIKIPTGFVPKHIFPGDKKAEQVSQTTNKESSSQRIKLSSKERSLLLGETTKTLEDVSPWTLKWDKKPENVENKPVEEPDGSNSNISRFSSRWDKQVHQERPKHKPDDPSTTSESLPTLNTDIITAPKISMYDANTGAFKPFAKFPSKQARYDEFLAAKRSGRKPEYAYDISVTEWERERELEEFARAAVLYRPLASAIATRFTRATVVTTNIDENKQVNKEESMDEVPDDKKAAKMGMYGKLTRHVLEWHPDRTLCKRFNIPNPYPQSKLKGVPSRQKKTSSFFNESSFDTSVAMIEDSKKDEDEEKLKEMLKKKEKIAGKNTIGPLSHLNKQADQITPPVKTTDTESTHILTDEALNVSAPGTKPSIDIFKAIFDNSDSSSSSDSSDGEDKNELETKLENKSSIKEQSTTVIEVTDFRQPEVNLNAANNEVNPLKHSSIGDALTPQAKLRSADNYDDNDDDKLKKDLPVLPLAFLNKKSSDPKNLVTNSLYKNNNNMENTRQNDRLNRESVTIRDHERTATADKRNTVVGLGHNKDLHKRHDSDRKKSEDECRPKNNFSDDEWAEQSKIKKHKKHKKEKKSKKSKKKKYTSDYSDDEEEKQSRHKQKKYRKHKKKEKEKRKISDSSSSDETLIPSNTELLQKLKKFQKSVKRPSAADFM